MAKKVAKKRGNQYSVIVSNLIKIPEVVPKSFWAREVKLAKRLCELYGYEKVLIWCPKYPYPSIAYLLNKPLETEQSILKNWLLLTSKTPKVKKYNIEDKPISEIKTEPLKKKTIKTWLN